MTERKWQIVPVEPGIIWREPTCPGCDQDSFEPPAFSVEKPEPCDECGAQPTPYFRAAAPAPADDEALVERVTTGLSNEFGLIPDPRGHYCLYAKPRDIARAVLEKGGSVAGTTRSAEKAEELRAQKIAPHLFDGTVLSPGTAEALHKCFRHIPDFKVQSVLNIMQIKTPYYRQKMQ
jgi:hypothetical protein